MEIATREWEGTGNDNCGKIPAQHNSFSHESRYELVCADYSVSHGLFWAITVFFANLWLRIFTMSF